MIAFLLFSFGFSMSSQANPYSPQEWRQLILQQQGLSDPLTSLIEVITRLSYVQIDSINVVERAHHHVLHTRLNNYQPNILAQALARSEVFEYWAHAAAYLPMEDYRFSLQRKIFLKQGDKHWFEPDDKVMLQVLARIKAEGPLKSSDFKQVGHEKISGWWDWKPAKKALEQLFMQGDIMVKRRDKFQKVYDLTERVLPSSVNRQAPSEDEFALYLITRFIQAQGLGTLKEIGYLRKGFKPALTRQLQQLLEAGMLNRFSQSGQDYYFDPNIGLNRVKKDRVWLINPFDNLIIQRQRLKQLFGFDYVLEVYVPEANRQFGYYSLAVLWKGNFIGHLDVKAQRSNGHLLLQNFFLTSSFLSKKVVSANDDFFAAFEQAVSDYAEFNLCQTWQLMACNDSLISRKYASLRHVDS
jgi:uncharacterized protein YcaQ